MDKLISVKKQNTLFIILTILSLCSSNVFGQRILDDHFLNDSTHLSLERGLGPQCHLISISLNDSTIIDTLWSRRFYGVIEGISDGEYISIITNDEDEYVVYVFRTGETGEFEDYSTYFVGANKHIKRLTEIGFLNQTSFFFKRQNEKFIYLLKEDGIVEEYSQTDRALISRQRFEAEQLKRQEEYLKQKEERRKSQNTKNKN